MDRSSSTRGPAIGPASGDATGSSTLSAQSATGFTSSDASHHHSSVAHQAAGGGESRSDVVAACEIIKDRFYFATLRCKPRSTSRTHYFCIDQELIYENFYSDFGPLNLAHIYRYCTKVNKKLKSYSLAKKKIVHYTSETPNNRVNAAFLAGCYQIIYLNKPATDVYKLLISSTRQNQVIDAASGASAVNLHLTHHSGITKEVLRQHGIVFKAYRDAALGPPLYLLSLLDCLVAIEKSKMEGWLDFEGNFNVDEYEYYERVENGDLNWLIPGQFIAFCGPHNKSKIEDGYPLHSPESYFPLFRKYNVSDVVRLNKKMYNAKRFSDAGFNHTDLFFIDGSCPSEEILQNFISLCEQRLRPEHGTAEIEGALAVHCKAGLGRTGTLIAAYIMKHNRWTAGQIIAWLRICRPGSVIGPQQIYLEEIQQKMFREGTQYHKKHNSCSKNFNYNNNAKQAINPEMATDESGQPAGTSQSRLYKKILASETAVAPNGLTQGDRLRAMKSLSQTVGTSTGPGSTVPQVSEKVTRSKLSQQQAQMDERTVSATGLGLDEDGFTHHGDTGYRMITRSRSKLELPSDTKCTSTSSSVKRQRGQTSSGQLTRPNTTATSSNRTSSTTSTNNSTKSTSRPRSVSHEQYTKPGAGSSASGRSVSSSTKAFTTVGLAPTNSALRGTNQILASAYQQQHLAAAPGGGGGGGGGHHHHQQHPDIVSYGQSRRRTTENESATSQQAYRPGHYDTANRYKQVPTTVSRHPPAQAIRPNRGQPQQQQQQQQQQQPHHQANASSSSTARNRSPRIASEMAKMKIASSATNYTSHR